MNGPDAIHGFPLTRECPSEAVLDAIELREEVGAAQRAHVEGCEICRARIAERHAAFDALDKAALVRSLHTKLAGVEAVNLAAETGNSAAPFGARKRGSFWGWLTGGISAAALATIALAVITRGPNDLGGSGEDSDLRSKGSIGLSVFVEHGGIVERAAPGADFRPGDRLRFEVDLPRDAHVMIVGVEADGRLYNSYPTTQSPAGSERLSRGPDQVLPGAVELDETLGREVLYLVACDHAFASGELSQAGGKLQVPAGCEATPFVLKKVDQR